MARDAVANVVDRLQERGFEPRRVGADAWAARCPGHRSTDHALAITCNSFNQVELSCSHNCRHFQIVGALGITNDHLYAETPDWLIERLRRVPIDSSSVTAADDQPAGEREEAGELAVVDSAISGLPGPGECECEVASELPAVVDPITDLEGADEPEPVGNWALEASSRGDFEHRHGNAIEVLVSAVSVNVDRREKVVERPSAVRILSRLAANLRVFRSADGRFCAQVPVGTRSEILGLRSVGFRDWLIDGYAAEHEEPPSSWAIGRVIGMLEARARFSEGIPEVYVRVGQGRDVDGNATGNDACGDGEGAYVIDLGDRTGKAVAIRESGWSVVDRPAVDFRRPEGLLALPEPARGGSIELLRKYVNLSERDFGLMVAWLTAALRPVGPYPVLVLNGEQASGKSTMARILRMLIDPQASPVLALPGGMHDLLVTAANGWLLVYENISGLPDWFSDGVCQLAFGAGFASRELFSSDERSVVYAQRPVILVGIDDFVKRPDLRDRAVFLHLPPIPRTSRKSERGFWPAFRADYPQILGGLFDAMAGGMRELPSVDLNELPRMADFAEWGEAVGRGLGWGVHRFLASYNENRKEATELILDNSPVAPLLLAIAKKTVTWTGTPLELYEGAIKGAGKRLGARWPKSVHTFGAELRKIAPQLRLHGLSILFERRAGKRVIVLKTDPPDHSSQV